MKTETATEKQVEEYMDRILHRNIKRFKYIIQNPFNKNKRKENIYWDWIQLLNLIDCSDSHHINGLTKDFPKKAIKYCKTKMDELK